MVSFMSVHKFSMGSKKLISLLSRDGGLNSNTERGAHEVF